MSKPKTASLNNGQAMNARKGRKQETIRAQASHGHKRPKDRKRNGTRFDELLGRGADLWDDLEFERFQAWLRQTRSSGD